MDREAAARGSDDATMRLLRPMLAGTSVRGHHSCVLHDGWDLGEGPWCLD